MRVTATEDFTAVVFGGQMLWVKKGDTFTGDVAAYLLNTGAAVEPGEMDDADEVPGTEDEFNPDGKIDDILAWVGDDRDRAEQAKAAEEAKGDKSRPRLIGKLAEILN